jgi:hypothetical protein
MSVLVQARKALFLITLLPSIVWVLLYRTLSFTALREVFGSGAAEYGALFIGLSIPLAYYPLFKRRPDNLWLQSFFAAVLGNDLGFFILFIYRIYEKAVLSTVVSLGLFIFTSLYFAVELPWASKTFNQRKK